METRKEQYGLPNIAVFEQTVNKFQQKSTEINKQLYMQTKNKFWIKSKYPFQRY